MGEVVSIDAARPHLSGEAVCSYCRHEWVSVAPVGTADFECPACGAMKGLFKYPCSPDEVWLCHCGNDLFYVAHGGFMCRECGTVQQF